MKSGIESILASKAKEIITSYCRHIYLEGNEKYFDDWLESPQAAAILSGEDWISVEKPPKGKDFYMTFDPNYLEQPIGIAYYQPYNDSWINDGGDEFHPSHYLPLPEPPKP